MPTSRFRLYEAFGERKPLGSWGRDPRCPTSRQGLYLRVRVLGLTVEQAFALGPHDPARPPTRPRKAAGRKPRRVTAWGEAKTPAEWVADPRARVAAAVILRRVSEGYAPEAAIATPRYVRTERRARQVTAWGESKTLDEWEADPRARVRAACIGQRVAAGVAAEAAISTPRYGLPRADRPG